MFTKTSTLLLAASALISISSAAPTWQYTRRQSNDTSSSGEVVYFTFQAAPVIFDFNLTTTAAGDKIYYTQSDLNIDSVNTTYDALSLCTFYNPSYQPIDPTTIVSDGAGTLTFGPPQVIAGVSCKSSSGGSGSGSGTGTCIPTYGDCEFSSPSTGTTLGTCCPGNICAATKCRPTSGTNSTSFRYFS